MPLSCRWYDMNAAFMSYASECDKNHSAQELARGTLAPRARGGVRSVPLAQHQIQRESGIH
jgi:hypothetical protein